MPYNFFLFFIKTRFYGESRLRILNIPEPEPFWKRSAPQPWLQYTKKTQTFLFTSLKFFKIWIVEDLDHQIRNDDDLGPYILYCKNVT